jgi:hypothetical protein
MTSELPRPNSIWRYRLGLGQTRVVYSSQSEVVAHNCEEQIGNEMMSWAGSPEFFHECFVPGDPDQYPRTAH